MSQRSQLSNSKQDLPLHAVLQLSPAQHDVQHGRDGLLRVVLHRSKRHQLAQTLGELLRFLVAYLLEEVLDDSLLRDVRANRESVLQLSLDPPHLLLVSIRRETFSTWREVRGR